MLAKTSDIDTKKYVVTTNATFLSRATESAPPSCPKRQTDRRRKERKREREKDERSVVFWWRKRNGCRGGERGEFRVWTVCLGGVGKGLWGLPVLRFVGHVCV